MIGFIQDHLVTVGLAYILFEALWYMWEGRP